MEWQIVPTEAKGQEWHEWSRKPWGVVGCAGHIHKVNLCNVPNETLEYDLPLVSLSPCMIVGNEDYSARNCVKFSNIYKVEKRTQWHPMYEPPSFYKYQPLASLPSFLYTHHR